MVYENVLLSLYLVVSVVAVVFVVKMLQIKRPLIVNDLYLERLGYELKGYEDSELYFSKNKGRYVVLQLNNENDLVVITNDLELDVKMIKRDYSHFKVMLKIEKER